MQLPRTEGVLAPAQPWVVQHWPGALYDTASYPVFARPRDVAELPTGTRSRRRRAPLLLRVGVILLSLCTLGALGGFVALQERPAWFFGLRHIVVPPVLASPTLVSPHPVIPAAAKLPPASGTADLSISSLNPSTGGSGTRILIVGQHLVGAGGYLVATFDGEPVPTNCPSDSECAAVVPTPPAGATTAIVQLETTTGKSNGMTFRYS